jgi:hypothetical protein
VLAEQRGRIQLALRNTLDDRIADSSVPVQSVDLGIDDPRKPKVDPPPRTVPLPVQVAPVAKPADPPIKVRIYRGDKVTEEAFK